MNRSLSTREKSLAAIVAIVVFVFVNVWLIDWAWKTATRLRADIAAKAKQLQFMRTLTEDLAFWEKRDAWLQAAQPRLTNADTAGVQLLDHVKKLAQKHGVLLENQAILVPGRQPEYISVSVDLETKSAWKSVINFLQELQRPEQFIALENSNLKIDPTDPTQMRGRFRIARWYAPNANVPVSP